MAPVQAQQSSVESTPRLRSKELAAWCAARASGCCLCGPALPGIVPKVCAIECSEHAAQSVTVDENQLSTVSLSVSLLVRGLQISQVLDKEVLEKAQSTRLAASHRL